MLTLGVHVSPFVFRIFLVLCVLTAAPLSAAEHPRKEANAKDLVVIGTSFVMGAKHLHEQRRITVYLPQGYEKGAGRYPVLYLLDGGAQEDFPLVAGLVQTSSANGVIRPILVIGIENTQRRRDLTGPTEVPEDRKIAPEVGGSAAFRAFLKEELMPRIDREYRVDGHRALMGESLAGLFVVETLLTDPGLFDTYIAISPSLWWNHRALSASASKRWEGGLTLPSRLFLSVANEGEGPMGLTPFLEALRSQAPKSLTWQYEPMPGESHASIYPIAVLKALRCLFPPSAP